MVDRIRLGDKYRLNKWLYSAYKTILGRTPGEKLSLEEADALGLERVVDVLEAKNLILHQAYSDGPSRHLTPCQSCKCRSTCKYCIQWVHTTLAAISEGTEICSTVLSSTVG